MAEQNRCRMYCGGVLWAMFTRPQSPTPKNRRTFEILHQEQQVRSRATDEVTLSIQNDVVERNLKLTSLACETAELQRRHTNPNPFLAARESAAEA